MGAIINGVYQQRATGTLTAEDVTATDDVTAGDDLTVAGFTVTGGASTSHSLGANGDVVVGGKLEVNNTAYFDSSSEFDSAATFNDDMQIQLGSNSDSILIYETANQDNDSLMIGVSDSGSAGDFSRALIICEKDDHTFNFAHPQQTNPTLFIHSANQATDEWISATHDGTRGVLDSGKGGVRCAKDLRVDADIIGSSDIFVDGAASRMGASSFDTSGGFIFGTAAQTVSSPIVATGTTANFFLFCEYADRNFDFAHAQQTNPTLFIHSANQATVEYATVAYNNVSISGNYGAFAGMKSITEEVTISVGNGSGGIETSGNLAPANSIILGAVARVTDAPGGGATTVDIGVTGSGNLDSLIDGMSTALDTTGTTPADGDGTQLPLTNGSATTLTLTTDLDVTGDEMKVRVGVFYIDFTPFTA